MPVLDEAGGIAAALAALQPLRERGHEVIVVDGGSTDATVALAQLLADRVLAAPRGRAAQMNAGAAAASGAALVFLHADTCLPPGADLLVSAALEGTWIGRYELGGYARDVTLTLANQRKRYGEIIACEPSRFLAELPPEDLRWEGEAATPEGEQITAAQAISQLRAMLGGR